MSHRAVPLAFLVASGCLFGPYDGQVVSSSTTPISPWGVYATSGAPISMDARWPFDGQFYAYSSATSTTSAYSAFGTSWYWWSSPTVAVPSWAWRSGVAGRRAEVRARSGTSLFESYPWSGASCMLDASAAGTPMTDAQWACGSATTPSAFLFTADYRGMPTFAPQSPEDYPGALEHDRTSEIQGVATTATDWYFTHNSPELVRIPLTSDLDTDDAWSDALATGLPSVLDDLGYDHFGDPDEYQGNVYVPVEGGAVGAIAQFDANLGFRGYATLPTDKAPWVAVDPTTGLLYTSAFCDVHTVEAYTMQLDVNGVLTGLTLHQERPLWDADSVPLTIQQVQGGAFSDRGNLYLVSDAKRTACANAGTAGIYGFEGATLRKETWFDVTYDPGDDEELEGLDVRDLTGAGIPGITGQLHLVMLDNDFWGDDLYFKHYVGAARELGFL